MVVTATVMTAPLTPTGVDIVYPGVFSVVIQPLCYLFCDLFFCKAAMNDGDELGSRTQPTERQY